MSSVIAQIDMMKFAGMDKAVFPAGAIITPSARDWASEHRIEIVIGEGGSGAGILREPEGSGPEKVQLLKYTIKAVLDNMNKAGGILKKDELTETVIACLKRLGCKVE